MSRFSRWLSLKGILAIYVVVPLSLSMAVTGYVALTMWERQVESRMQTDLEMVARAIQLPLSHAIERDRPGGMQQALKSAIAIDSVYGAYAYDLEGRKIASAGQDEPLSQRERLTELAVSGEQKGEYGIVGERSVYSYFVPLIDSRNQSSGLLQLTRRRRDFREYIDRVRRHAVIVLGLGVVAMSILVLIGHYQALEKHFGRLIAGMERVAHGDTSHRVTLSGPREIVTVSSTFNDMLDSIQAAEEELRVNRQEQLRLERQLRQTEKLAAVGQLAAGVAHELGTPLTTISATAQRSLRRMHDGSRLCDDLERIRGEVHRMEVIIRQLLDFSHSRDLQKRVLRVSPVVEAAIDSIADEARSSGVEVESIVDEDSASTSEIVADPIRLEQVMVNLLRNAIQTGSTSRVVISSFEDGDHYVIRVEDDGPGIPEEIRPRLFEPFFTTKDVGAGTGLGLAVVHGILREHGGKVHVGTSRLGGASIDVCLPLHHDEMGDGV